MGHDGMKSQQWPRSMNHEDRPTPLMHLTATCHEHELVCGGARRGRQYTDQIGEVTCVWCMRVATALVLQELAERPEPS
jgi:hypothetical protein